ncbi:MAG: NUDIX domain-containing protein [Nanoarchaeota archaeon]
MNSALREFSRLAKKLPRFPDGRLNYKNSKKAVVITVFVEFNSKILLLKRSNKVLTYKGFWNVVAGYYDEPKPLRQKALEELNEETGITKKFVKSIQVGKMFRFHDKKISRIWIVNPVLIRLKKKPRIKLDFEHTESKWVKHEEIKKYKVVPNLLFGLGKVVA